MDDVTPDTVPAGVDLRLSAPSFPPHPALLDRLRTYTRLHPRVGAVHVFAMATGDEPPRDVIGITVEGDATDHATLVKDLELAVIDVLPQDTDVSLTVLTARAQLDLLPSFAPIGAGGPVEVACAATLSDPTAVRRLALALAAARLVVPALAADAVGPTPDAGTPTTADHEPASEPAEPDGDPRGPLAALDELLDDPSAAPRPELLQPGEAVRWPLTRMGRHEVVSVFSSWPALLRTDPPFDRHLLVRGEAILRSLPPGAALAVDPGCLHAVVIPAEDMPNLLAHLDEPV